MNVDKPVVELQPGTRAVGKRMAPAEGGEQPVYAFLGLPYAKPPVGELRFQPPKPVDLWIGDRDATQYGAVCPQDMSVWEHHPTFSFKIPTNMSEDCLSINVWTPTLNPHSETAVMVSIHGGGFSGGFADAYHGTGLVSLGNVIVVTMNYRLNILGFMTTGDDVASGNYGLLDQIEALRWVRDNIRAFGGDPDNVTIFGESAGGMSVSALLLSPLARGLFRKAVCQSGTVDSIGFLKTAKEAFKSFLPILEKMGCKSQDSKEIMAFLREKPTDALMEHLTPDERFTPVIDGHVLHADDEAQGRSRHGDHVDVIIGLNSHEGAIMASYITQFKFPDMKAVRDGMLALVQSAFDTEATDIDGMLDEMIEEYIVDQSSEEALSKGWVEWGTDFFFTHGSMKTALSQAKSPGKTYVYYYQFRDSFNQYPAWVGADHGDELAMVLGWPLFDTSDILELKSGSFDEESRKMSKFLIKYWTNFAKTGDPNSEGLPDWPLYTPNEQQHIVMDKEFSIGHHLKADKVAFWERLVVKYAGEK